MEGTAEHDNAEQPSLAMDFPSQTQPLEPQAFPEQPPPSPKSDSCATTKRDFESAFPDLLPVKPVKPAKRLRSNSDSLIRPSTGDTGSGNNDATLGDTFECSEATADNSYETAQAQPQSPIHSALPPEDLQGAPATDINTIDDGDGAVDLDDTERVCNYSRDEIHRHITIIKQNFPGNQIELSTVEMLVDEIMAFTAAENSATQGEISGIRWRIGFLPDGMFISPAEPRSNKTASQRTTPSLSELISSTPALRSNTIAPSPMASVEFENMATQTEPVTAPHDGVAQRHSISDNKLWERELELIRRPQPLFRGACITVNVPLRETTSTLNSVKGNHKPILKSKLALGNKDIRAISLSDTSEDDGEGGYVRASQRVGGGDMIYGENGAEFFPSDEEEEAEADVPMGFRIPQYQSQFSSNGATVEDLPDYEDYENYEDTNEEAMTGYAENINSSMVPMARSRHFSANNYGYQNEEDVSSLVVYDDVIGLSRPNNRGCIPTSRGYAATAHMGIPADRERSRSPGRQRTKYFGEDPYLEGRYHPRRYVGVDVTDQSRLSASSTQAHHKDLDDAGHKLESQHDQDGLAWLQIGNLYNGKSQRYMREEQEDPSFYGYSIGTTFNAETKKTLRYQDRFTDAHEIPGPKTGLRLKLDDYVHETGINKEIAGLEQGIQHVVDKTFYAGETMDEEQAWERGWAKESTKLYKGFPLVENIEFVSAENRIKPTGDCYWRALAYSLHGMPHRWDMIKADHLAYLQHVLGDKTHPRHELYTKLNGQFFESNGPVSTFKFRANLWQLLHMPHAWTPGVMQQITADLYNIHLVTFSYDRRKNLCSEVSVRGAYNSRHVFMLFANNCHFQPLAVNEYLS
ncbi:hypothetical protein F5Y10DRAFT_284882 [Nemania abortiva]|nr:hypothetical protein F5Y10DRAFT_284882 [Nemania abortiva]